MKLAGASLLLLGAALVLGCSAAGSATLGGGSGAGRSDSGGNMGIGGSMSPAADAGASSRDGGIVIINGDAAGSAVSNLTGDAPVFNWDTLSCSGCPTTNGGAADAGAGGNAGGPGGRGSGGAASGSGGWISADASVGFGGSTGAAGSSAGGGGWSGTGGTPFSPDASWPLDSGSDAAAPPSDLPVVVVADAGGADVVPLCVAQIVPMVPVLSAFSRIVAGANTKVVLRAQVVSGSLPPGASWSWQAWWGTNSSPLSVAAIGKQDPAAAAFAIANAGSYTFQATAGGCQATLRGVAVGANACTDCDKYPIVRAAPAAAADVPVQTGPYRLLGSPPFDQYNVVLERGAPVRASASVGSNVINSYVRINDEQGGLVVDGWADARAGGLFARLMTLGGKGAILRYDVLVVPLDGPTGETIGASAPQLFQSLVPSSINGVFALAGGVTVTGTTLDASGAAVGDVRVMLTNQNPASAQQRRDLLFSSVGSSDSKGKFSLHVQKGTYWVSFSPPSSVEVSEALGASSITLGGDAGLDFKWDAADTASLALRVVDSAGGVPASPVSVRVTSSESRSVGAFTLTPAGGSPASLSASGNVQMEATSNTDGTVVFPRLPANANYDVLLIPSKPDGHAATTTMSVTVATGGTSLTAQLWPQSNILGQLVARRSGAAALDFGSVSIIAYDRSPDSPEAARAIKANPDGSFAFGVSPGRPYVLLAAPDAGSGYARTFVGPGPVQASEFVITQSLLSSMAWQAVVTDDSQRGLSDTALQVFCQAIYPNCVDPNVPLAETTSGDGGSFQLALQDPSSR